MKSFLGAEMDFRQTLSLLQEDKKDKQCVLREMMSADFEIKDVIITGTTDAPIISMVHSIYDANGEDVRYSLPLELESVGMQKFFAYIGFWLEALKTGSVLVVDGIESNMHPLLTRHFDSNFLQCDQAWFAEKDEKTMQTSVYALSNFALCKGISQIMPGKRK